MSETPSFDHTETVPPPDSERTTPHSDGREVIRAAMVDRYAVLSHLGSGGMGSVYAAYDPDLDRKVALKLVRRDRGSHRDQERLLSEARALARMTHPNVVQVYDVGLHGDSVFFAMEFVSGLNLRRWLAAETPGWRRVVSLFQGAGRGLAVAHGRGLIHRDLKPENILVGEDGAARIADFGLVKWTEEAGTGVDTAAAAVDPRGSTEPMGTPGYMAPEVAAGETASELSDQYGFCVAFHVALYGEYPSAHLSDGSTGRASKPARGLGAPAAAAVPAALRKILRRGLQTDPRDRYPSMDALLHDLSRLAGRRRKALTAAGIVVLIGLAVTPWLTSGPHPAAACEGGEQRFAEVWNGERRSALGKTFEASTSSFASEAFDGVVRILDDYRSEWVASYRDTCLATRARGEQSERMLDLRMLCLEQRREEVGALVDLLQAGGADLVPAAVKGGESLPHVGACDANPELALLTPLPEDAELLHEIEQFQPRLAQQELRQSIGRPVDLEELESLAEIAGDIGYRPLQAQTRKALAISLAQQKGDVDAAVETLELALTDAIGGGDRATAAVLYGHLAEYTGYNQGNPERGEWWGRFADESLAGLTPGHQSERFSVHSSLGLLAWTRGEMAQARGHWRRALDHGGEAYGADSPLLAQTLNNLALAAEQDDEAIRYLERALAIKEQAYGSEIPLLANTLVNLGAWKARSGRYREVLPHTTRAISILAKAHGPDHPSLAYPLILEGELLNILERYDEAVAKLERARPLAHGFGESHPMAIQIDLDLAAASLGQLRPERAQKHLDRADALTKDFPDSSPIRLAIPLLQGQTDLLRGNYEAALTALEQAWSLAHQHAHMRPPLYESIRLRLALAECHLVLGQPDRARPLLEQALDLSTPNGQLKTLTAKARSLLAQAVEAASPSAPSS
ncbi:MAG: tetratricopeptide repeat protein [Acidobacteriota bacterium]